MNSYFEKLPPALRPVYTTTKPNVPIKLYEGDSQISQEINQQEIKILGHGTVEYIWYPSPRIKFKFEIYSQELNYLVDFLNYYHRSALLTLSDIETSLNVFIDDISVGGDEGDWLSGRATKPVSLGTGQNLANVIFHVANFPKFIGRPPSALIEGLRKRTIERIELKEQGWKLTLEQLETIQDNVRLLDAQGGFAITHVGKLEQLDGQTFSAEEAREFLDIFAHFLSFARGFKVPLILYIGFDSDENKIWEYWDSSGGNSWKYVSSWFDKNKAGKLAEVFPGFLCWWQDWKDSARLIINSYLETNYITTVDVKILLSQISLELIARILLVEKESTIEEKDFDKHRPASDKLRLLLWSLGIPSKLPPTKITLSNKLRLEFLLCGISLGILCSCPKIKLQRSLLDSFQPKSTPILEELVEFTSQNNLKDGLHTLTEIRNHITHPKKKYDDLTFEVMFNASDLGLWYLELVLLAIFKYQGQYCNRLLNYTQNGQTEQVPWGSSIEQA